MTPPSDVLPLDDLLVLDASARDAATSTYKAERMLRRAENVGAVDALSATELDPDRILLLPNAQFIYELVLARMELRAFHLDSELDVGMRSASIRRQTVPADFLRRTAYFQSAGLQTSDYAQLVRFNRMNSVNQYLTHWIYPYKGKFHPQMIRAILNILGLKGGDTILDPFVGSGTALLEAMLLGINSIGVDASPLCVLQCEVKTCTPVASELIRQDACRDRIMEGENVQLISLLDVRGVYWDNRCACVLWTVVYANLEDRLSLSGVSCCDSL